MFNTFYNLVKIIYNLFIYKLYINIYLFYTIFSDFFESLLFGNIYLIILKYNSIKNNEIYK